MGKFVHRGFVHPGGVSPVKQEDPFYIDGDGMVVLQDPGQINTPSADDQRKKKAKEIKKEESMTPDEKRERDAKQSSSSYTATPTAKEIFKGVGNLVSFLHPGGDVAVASTEAAEGDIGSAATTLGLALLPGSSAFWKGLFKGGKKSKKLNKKTKEIVKKNNPKTNIEGKVTDADTQPFPDIKDVKLSKKELLDIQRRNFDIKKHNIQIDRMINYRKGGRVVMPKSALDWMKFDERIDYVVRKGIKDDYLFPGGITKRGNKYFESTGVEIPLDPNVTYIPIGNRNVPL